MGSWQKITGILFMTFPKISSIDANVFHNMWKVNTSRSTFYTYLSLPSALWCFNPFSCCLQLMTTLFFCLRRGLITGKTIVTVIFTQCVKHWSSASHSFHHIGIKFVYVVFFAFLSINYIIFFHFLNHGKFHIFYGVSR